jgi:protein ImuB
VRRARSGEATEAPGKEAPPAKARGGRPPAEPAPARALVALCADWAVIAAGRTPSAKVAVVAANRVVCLSPAARSGGVHLGLCRREAQARCPDLEVLQSDLGAEARCWEPAVAAVEVFAPGVEVLGPGVLALAVRGPSRYFGGDRALAAKVVAAIEAAVAGRVPGWDGCCRVGVADGLFAATLAARHAPASSSVVVPRGRSRDFLAPLPVSTLPNASGYGISTPRPAQGEPRKEGSHKDSSQTGDLAELVDLLVRLGTRTLGDFAALPAHAVLGRFGASGLRAHRLARGLEGRPLRPRQVPPDWTVAVQLNPPAKQLHAAAFAGKALADQLTAQLAGQGLVCTRLTIEVETEHGERLRRSWRHEGALGAGAIAERVRWQLEGWAQEGGVTAGVTKLALVPEEVHPDDGRQLGLWGKDAAAPGRVARALARVQGLLGPEGVLSAMLQGGRDHADQVHLAPWGEPREPLRPSEPPWPGRLPGLAPGLVHQPPMPAQVTDAADQTVSVSSRGVASAPPAWLVLAPGGGRPLAIEAWAGPWPLEERWWDQNGRRRARFQVVTSGGGAYLVVREKRGWWVEATYD